MVGPSASGSLKGMPSSMTSAPDSARARTNFSVASREGSPAVMKATTPISPEARSSWKRREMREAIAEVGFILQWNRLSPSQSTRYQERGKSRCKNGNCVGRVAARLRPVLVTAANARLTGPRVKNVKDDLLPQMTNNIRVPAGQEKLSETPAIASGVNRVAPQRVVPTQSEQGAWRGKKGRPHVAKGVRAVRMPAPIQDPELE